jgi:hypothetical protein
LGVSDPFDKLRTSFNIVLCRLASNLKYLRQRHKAMKKIVAIFSVFALFSIAAVAQEAPKNTVKPKASTSKVTPNKKYIGKKAVKANVPAAKMNTK